jgi:hypothetical protein
MVPLKIMAQEPRAERKKKKAQESMRRSDHLR